MVDEEKLRKKAKIALNKAEILLDNEEYKKSGANFKKAGELFQQLGEWRIAEKCFFYASKNLTRLGKYHQAALAEREAANSSLRILDYQKARDYFDVAAKSIMKAEKAKLENFAAENIGFAFLCYFVQGKYQDGINYVKRFKAKISPEIFESNLLLRIAQYITNAVINKNEDLIDELIDNYSLFQFSEMENRLIKESLVVALSSLMITLEITLSENEFERDSLIEIHPVIDTTRLQEFKNYQILPHEFTVFNVVDMHIKLGDNLTIKERPKLPITLDLKNFKKESFDLVFRSNIPGASFIGPIILTMNVDDKFSFALESDRKDINITAPDAVLGITLTPEKTPVINQSFPVQVLVSNKSDGNAMEIEIEFEFPEDLKMMRGTFKKNIYSLSPNEQLHWQILVKAFDVGEFPIKTIVSFKDEDGNLKGPFSAEIPLTINL